LDTRFKIGLAILVMIGLGTSVQARPRDEVMSQAFRCGGISDSHLWLDCIYGSAQPIRTELKLVPITSHQAELVASPPVTGGPIGDQPARDQVLANATRCGSLTADRQWLDCFYSATNAMRLELGLPITPIAQGRALNLDTANQVASADVAAMSQTQDHFGLAPKPKFSTRYVKSELTSYEFDRYGIFTVKLANGQVWHQVSGDTTYAHWKEAAATYTATITKGALGSYNMRVKDNPGSFKVERVL
jgi:hypothetical protein